MISNFTFDGISAPSVIGIAVIVLLSCQIQYVYTQTQEMTINLTLDKNLFAFDELDSHVSGTVIIRDYNPSDGYFFQEIRERNSGKLITRSEIFTQDIAGNIWKAHVGFIITKSDYHIGDYYVVVVTKSGLQSNHVYFTVGYLPVKIFDHVSESTGNNIFENIVGGQNKIMEFNDFVPLKNKIQNVLYNALYNDIFAIVLLLIIMGLICFRVYKKQIKRYYLDDYSSKSTRKSGFNNQRDCHPLRQNNASYNPGLPAHNKQFKSICLQQWNLTKFCADNSNIVYLFDTSVLYSIVRDKSILDKIQNNSIDKSIMFVWVDRLMEEYVNLEINKPHEKYVELIKKIHNDVGYSYDTFKKQNEELIKKIHNDVEQQLLQYGDVFHFEYGLPQDIKPESEKTYEKKEFKNKNGEYLSKVDCLIVQCAKHYQNTIIITNDRTIEIAANKYKIKALTFYDKNK